MLLKEILYRHMTKSFKTLGVVIDGWKMNNISNGCSGELVNREARFIASRSYSHMMDKEKGEAVQ